MTSGSRINNTVGTPKTAASLVNMPESPVMSANRNQIRLPRSLSRIASRKHSRQKAQAKIKKTVRVRGKKFWCRARRESLIQKQARQ